MSKAKSYASVPWNKEPRPTSQNPSLQTAQNILSATSTLFTKEYIKQEHGDLITGLTRLYKTFEATQYIDAQEILYPPHLSGYGQSRIARI
jgi:hypothetical protein